MASSTSNRNPAVAAPSSAVAMHGRRLGAEDRAAVLEHLARLRREDLELRFGYAVAPDALERYVQNLDFERDIFWALAIGSGALQAMVQVMPLAWSQERSAELAFSVDPAARGQGLGKCLLRTAIELAQANGISRLIAQVCPRNAAMLTVLRGAGMTLQREESEIVGVLDLARTDELREVA